LKFPPQLKGISTLHYVAKYYFSVTLFSLLNPCDCNWKSQCCNNWNYC